MSLGQYSSDSLTVDVSVSTVAPGEDQNPYEVRSINQFQLINWNLEHKNTDTVFSVHETDNFPYLSCGDPQLGWVRNDNDRYWQAGWFEHNHYHYKWELRIIGYEAHTRSFCWTQTHDISGGGGTYTPIAELYDTTTGQSDGIMHGWFGGTYDGDSYLIEDVNIQGGDSSCAGLFGVVFNGTLENIVLYSENGAWVKSHTNDNDSVWYAIGGLAGVAGSTDPNGAVQNCAVAGYSITDTHTGGGGWGGSAVGGLIGMCHMSLNNCTAVAQVTYGAHDTDNERVGGLVGACIGSITNCYAGGSITVTDDATSGGGEYGIYVGGITSSSYMKELTVPGINYTLGGNGDNGLYNCYTYTELPANSNTYIKGLYAIGGDGDLGRDGIEAGDIEYRNNYYLASIVFRNYGVNGKAGIDSAFLKQFQENNGNHALPESDIVTVTWVQDGWGSWNGHYEYAQRNHVTPVDYADLAGAPIGSNTGGAAYNSLTAGDYEPITALNGRYSFSSPRDETTDAAYMERYTGLDYPFPAILTQDSELTDSGTAYVHYGWWPLRGIVRQYGSGPIQLDLFSGGGTYSETLSLSSDLGPASGGTWAVSGGDDVVEATLSQNSGTSTTLTVTALQPGETVLTVSCEGESVTIPVTVTAELGLRTAKDVVLFPGETARDVPLTWVNGEGTPIADDQLALIQVVGNAYSVSYDPDQLTGPYVSQVDGKPYLTVTAGGQGGQSASLTVSFRFTVGEGGPEQSGSGVVHVEILDAALSPADTTFTGSAGSCAITGVTVDGQSYSATVRSVRSETAGLGVTAAGNQLTFTVTDSALTQGLVRVTVEVTYGDETRAATLPLAVTITPQTP